MNERVNMIYPVNLITQKIIDVSPMHYKHAGFIATIIWILFVVFQNLD